MIFPAIPPTSLPSWPVFSELSLPPLAISFLFPLSKKQLANFSKQSSLLNQRKIYVTFSMISYTLLLESLWRVQTLISGYALSLAGLPSLLSVLMESSESLSITHLSWLDGNTTWDVFISIRQQEMSRYILWNSLSMFIYFIFIKTQV